MNLNELYAAIKLGDLSKIKSLHNEYGMSQPIIDSGLFYAARLGKFKIVSFFLGLGVTKCARKKALLNMTSSTNAGILKALLEKDVDVWVKDIVLMNSMYSTSPRTKNIVVIMRSGVSVKAFETAKKIAKAKNLVKIYDLILKIKKDKIGELVTIGEHKNIGRKR